MRCKSGKRYYTRGNLYSTSFILYICGNRYPISWSSQKEQIICRQMSKTSSTELKLAEDLASSELVCHTQRSGCIQFCNNEKIFHTLELIPHRLKFWKHSKIFVEGTQDLKQGTEATKDLTMVHLGIYILHRSSFTYVGIDIPSVEVLKKNKLFVDRCQKHQVQNWSWPKISRVRNWYVIRNGLAVYNFAIMKRSSTRWNWYPIGWSFENIRKSLSKEHKISSKELKLPKILQRRNRYDYPEGVQIKHPFCMYDTCCSTRLGGFGAPLACFTPFIQVTNKIRAYR